MSVVFHPDTFADFFKRHFMISYSEPSSRGEQSLLEVVKVIFFTSGKYPSVQLSISMVLLLLLLPLLPLLLPLPLQSVCVSSRLASL